jgi:hypothetical protein
MTRLTLLVFVLIAAAALLPAVAFAAEAVIFSEELPSGASLEELHADSQFVVSSDNPYEGSNHLKRELAAGDWSWITGISGLNLDLTDIDFDEAFVEFYIDSGTVAIGYIELRIAGADWDPDSQVTIQTDGVPGYEKISVMLKDFNVKQLERSPANLDEFTGGTGKIDRWSIGFSPADATVVVVDEVKISDGKEVLAAVRAEHKLAIRWGKIKSR